MCVCGGGGGGGGGGWGEMQTSNRGPTKCTVIQKGDHLMGSLLMSLVTPGHEIESEGGM